MQLREHSVKQALEALSWEKLKVELDAVQFDATVADEVAGLVLRSTGLLIKRSDPERAAAPARLFERVLQYAAERGAKGLADRLHAVLETIELIDRGYQGILEMLAGCDISKLAPEVRASACSSQTLVKKPGRGR